jgi:serine/threonine-protein kinase
MALVLYRAMTGQPAYSGESTPQILFDIVYKMPMRPSHAQKTLSSDVDLVMAIALAKDPSDRFLSAIEFADAFADACRRKLAGPLRTHGAELTRALPWGTSIATRPSDAP